MNGKNDLPKRQGEVLVRLANGRTTKQIAYDLGISPRTVMAHLAVLKQRFGAQTRAHLVWLACKAGLLG